MPGGFSESYRAFTSSPIPGTFAFGNAAATATARGQWPGAKPLGQTQHVELLLDAQGKPLEDVAGRLTRQRDNRPMTLQE